MNVNVELRCDVHTFAVERITILLPLSGLAECPDIDQSSTGTSVSLPMASALNLRASTLMVDVIFPIRALHRGSCESAIREQGDIFKQVFDQILQVGWGLFPQPCIRKA